MTKDEIINDLRNEIKNLRQAIDYLQEVGEYGEPQHEDNDMSYRDQCNADRSDDIQARLERGEIDEENAAELRMGA